MDYLGLIQNAIDTIEDNISEKMLVSDLAGAAYCSDAHFSRIFHLIVGIAVMDYVRSRRLSLAGRDLAFTKNKVIDTALKFGYETPEAFAKAFKRFHGVSPIECRKTCTFKYQERFFPTVVKMQIMRGDVIMTKFGSPLHQIINDLDKSSSSMYYCFNFHNARYAVKAVGVNEIHSLKGLYLNTKNELCLFYRGGVNIPVAQIDDSCGMKDVIEGRHNILICRRDNTCFGLLIEGNPELKIVKSIDSVTSTVSPFISGIGQFEDEQMQIINTHEFFNSKESKLAKTFDKVEDFAVKDYSMNADSLDRLEYAAYEAELLARNASIEAANGMQHHKGTMVVAYELHQLAVEIAKIAHDLRLNHN